MRYLGRENLKKFLGKLENSEETEIGFFFVNGTGRRRIQLITT